jgi:hypothetical protein
MTTCTVNPNVTESQFEEILDDVMDQFDFDKVHRVMEFMDWVWVTTDGHSTEVPSISRLKQAARKHLRRAFAKNITIGSGGLEASYVPPAPEWKGEDPYGLLELRFVLEEQSNEGYRPLVW